MSSVENEKSLQVIAARVRKRGSRGTSRVKTPRNIEHWLSILTLVLAGLWTIVMWGMYGLVTFSDELIRAGVSFLNVDAQTLQWLMSVTGGVQQFGEALVLIVWMLGVLLLLLASWIGRRLTRRF